jgi:ABC-type uncharacterized transport system substrate-binding protein
MTAVLIWGTSASGHPHVWIEAEAEVRFEGGTITAIGLAWTFDEWFAASLLEGFDLDGDGALGPGEIDTLRQETTASLADYGFFTHLLIGGERSDAVAVADFRIEIDGPRVVYRFDVPIDPPVDPRATAFAFALYDDSYYVDVAVPGPVTLAGDVPGGCAEERSEDTGTPLYYGSVFPMLIGISCP